MPDMNTTLPTLSYVCSLQVNSSSSGQKNIPLKPRKQARISAVLKSAKFSFDGTTSSPASSSRANSPTPGTYGEGRSTQNSPSVSCAAPDTQLKSSHHPIKGLDLAWLS
ncbi:hypothetical protein GOODEAATRI_000673 [Goodea atripinnis]|uniref:Uncharacterized protein n=1 Tax=Goodea atripinnis TaxID=208336 RepID=A0ABV0MDX7_9TELE